MLTFPIIMAFVDIQILSPYFYLNMLYRSIQNYLIHFEIHNSEFNGLFNIKLSNFKDLAQCLCAIEPNTFKYFRSSNNEGEITL